MSIKELIKKLNDIKTGEGEFPLPDTMIDEIIKRLEELEVLRQENEKRVKAKRFGCKVSWEELKKLEETANNLLEENWRKHEES